MKKLTAKMVSAALILLSLCSCAGNDDPKNKGQQKKGNPNIQGGMELINTLKGYPIDPTLDKAGELEGKTREYGRSEMTEPDIVWDKITGTDTPYCYDSKIKIGEGHNDLNIPGVKIYRDMRRKVKGSYSEQHIYSDNFTGLHPGYVMRGNTISNGTYASVDFVEMSPIVISGNFLPAEGADPEEVMSKEINPTRSAYSNAYKSWFQGKVEEGYVMSSVDLQEVSVNTKGGLDAEGNFTIKEALNIGFNIHSTASSMKSHVLVRFVQRLFTVSMDRPNKPFIQALDVTQLGGTKPAYVSDIHYGRICYALFSSTANSADLVASIKALFRDASGKDQGGSATGNIASVAEKSNVQFRIIGGTQKQHGDALKDATGQNLKSFLAAPINVRNAAPISFVLRFVDDNARVRVVYRGEETYQEVIFIPYTAKKLYYGAQVSEIKVKNKSWSHANVYGEVFLSIPQADKVHLFKADQNQYIRIPNDQQWHSVKAQTSKHSLTIDMTKRATSEWIEYLGWSIGLKVDLYSAPDRNEHKGSKLGSVTIYKPIRDFIYDCQQGYMDVKVGAPGVLDTWAEVRIALDEMIVE